MKRFLSSLLFLALMNTVSAQVFQFHYGTTGDEDAYPLKALPDGGFVSAGSTTRGNAGGKDATLIRANSLGQLQWMKAYGGSGDETALYVQRTSDGGFVLCGETFSATPNGDAFLCRTDSLGNFLWWKNYGGANYDIAYSVIQLSDGGFVVAGLTEGTVQYDYDAFLLRTDANGDTVWAKKYGGPGIDHAVQVIQTSDAGFLFCGKILSYGAGSCDCWLVKTDANGDTLWTNIIGGTGWDESMSLTEQPDGYAVCGGSSSPGSSGSYDFMLLKTDLSGNLQWSKLYGGSNIEASYCIVEIPNSGYAFCGYTETFGPGHSRGTDSANVFLVRTDYNGDTLWAAAFGGTLKEECFGLVRTQTNGFALSGYTGSFGDSLQAYIFTTDSLGYAGCNEKRSSPDIHIPVFMETHHAVNVARGLNVTSPAIVSGAITAQQTQVCGGPLNENEITPAAIAVYPNPSNGIFAISGTGTYAHVYLYDSSGLCLKEWTSFHEKAIDLGRFPAGMYLLQLIDEEGNIHSQRLIKE